MVRNEKVIQAFTLNALFQVGHLLQALIRELSVALVERILDFVSCFLLHILVSGHFI